MYLQHFNLQDSPFSIAPNPRYLYLGKRHQEALAHLIFGLRGEGGVVVLTGEVGTGKTTISRKLLEDIPADTDIAWIVNPKLSVEELLATICDELHIKYQETNHSIKIYTDLINHYLLAAHGKGRNTVLMIDEAQNLSPEVLEQLRLLTNLETSERKLLQIVLLGQDELKDMLARHDMRQLAQRVTARYHLSPLNAAETAAYINHRLGIAGCQRMLFKPGAVRAIHKHSRGIPRLINLLCDRSLLGAYAGDRHLVEPIHVRQAAKEVLGLPENGSRMRPVFIATTLVAAIAAILIFTPFRAITYVPTFRPVPEPSAALSPEQDVAIVAPALADKSMPPESAVDEPLSPQPATNHAVAAIPIENPWPEISRLGSKQLAYQTLLHLWQPDALLAGMSGDPCAALMEHSLRCLPQRGDWGLLRNLDRPAVLRLTNDGQETFATLIAISADTATLQLGEQQWEISLAELERHWFADFTVVWQTPPGFSDTLRPGDGGEAVSWLALQLDKVQGELIPPHSSKRMDAVLVSRVKDFQRSRGLNPDGAAGPLTLIQLNNATDTHGPRLQRAGSR